MTLEEFTKSVWAYFAAWWPRLSVSEAERYFGTEKVKRHIKQEYDRALKEFYEGKLTREQFEVGRASAVGECLALMY